uniref:Uncharacterized protein n=1 Tax=Bacillus subtilis subsp. natto TaxID=86029 RepID=E9RJ28_BACNA|nr:hypothetical protein [Bacillus subtilis subsp. natto]
MKTSSLTSGSFFIFLIVLNAAGCGNPGSQVRCADDAEAEEVPVIQEREDK